MQIAGGSAQVSSLHLDGDVGESKVGAQQLRCLDEDHLSVGFLH